MKRAVFWDVAPCRYLFAPAHTGSSLADFIFFFFFFFFYYPEDGGDTFLRDVD
jgi:hypothetical protein